MFNFGNKKGMKTFSTILVILLALAMVVPTILWALNGV